MLPCNIHNHLWEVFFRFNSSCTRTPPLCSNLPDRRPFFEAMGVGGVEYFPCQNFEFLSFHVLSSKPCSCQLLVFNASLCCLSPFHLFLCRFFKAMLLIGTLPQQSLINRLMSHQHVQI